MGILKHLPYWIRRWVPGDTDDILYLGHHCNLKRIHKGGEPSHQIPFPVCLAAQHDADLPVVYEDFSLNLEQGAAFVETDDPLPEGNRLVLHFYIPPEKKLLAEFTGMVVTANRGDNYPHGMYIELSDGTSHSLEILGEYLDEHRHLLDRVA